MTYATKQDMITRFGFDSVAQITSTVDGKTIDDDVLNAALGDAFNFINGFLAARYETPVVTRSTQLVQWECDIARYYLFRDDLTEVVRQRYEDAVSTLRLIKANKYDLTDATSVVASDIGSVNDVSFFAASARVFGGSVV